MKRLRIGVVGLRFGHRHVQTLALMDRAELVALADRNPSMPEGLEAYAGQFGARPYADALEMLEREELDAVSICIPPRHRGPMIELAARKGVAMFIEKPWATDLAHARRLAELCREHRARVMVGFSFRFLPAIAKLAELMKGELGPGWVMNAEYLFDWLPPQDNWLWDPENGNGFINENSCHLFDAVRHLLGEPASLTAVGFNHHGRPSAEAAAISVRFESGAIAALTVGGLGAGAHQDYPRLDIVTENGQARLRGRNHLWERLTWSTRGSSLLETFHEAPDSIGTTGYTRAFGHFFDCLDRGEEPAANVRDGILSVAFAEAVYTSLKTGATVELKDLEESGDTG